MARGWYRIDHLGYIGNVIEKIDDSKTTLEEVRFTLEEIRKLPMELNLAGAAINNFLRDVQKERRKALPDKHDAR